MEWALWAQRFAVALTCAEGLLVLSSVETIKIALKKPAQRSPGEGRLVARGLFREFVCEALIFVPVSVVVAMIVLRPVLAEIGVFSNGRVDGLLGVVSYGFPYRTIKAWVLHASVKFLKEAAEVADKQVIGERQNQEDPSDAAKT